MHLDLWQSLAGLLVGFTVGLTGMGGGALMTPVLVLLFGINPGTAVSSDLLTSLVMKPVGAGVHQRRGTVDWTLVRWLALGSVPTAFCGVLVLHQLGSGTRLAHRIEDLLGWALIIAATAMCAKAFLAARSGRQETSDEPAPRQAAGDHPHRGGRRLHRGHDLGGLGLADDGDAPPALPPAHGQAPGGHRPAATLGHALFGHIDLGLTGSLLIGSLPGVYLGARVSSRAPDAIIRPALIVILFGSALKLLNFSTVSVLWAVVILVVVAFPLWGATDASLQPAAAWDEGGYRRTVWVTAQAVAAPFGIGFPVAVAYFARARPRLMTRSGAQAELPEARGVPDGLPG